MCPGSTATTNYEDIQDYVNKNNAVVISVNFRYDKVKPDYMYFSNIKRYSYWSNDSKTADIRKIITSNITSNPSNNEMVVSFVKLVKCGWEHMDNSAILLLRLLDKLNVKVIAIAGFDGFNYDSNNAKNFASNELELANINSKGRLLNKEIEEMLKDFIETKTGNEKIEFITPSRFDFLKVKYD